MTTPPGFGPPIPTQPPYGTPPPLYMAPPAPYGSPAPGPYGAPPPGDGPEFVAHDRRSSVIVDPSGVSLEINGHTMDFPWAAVATVHHAPSPHGGAILMVAVAHPGGMLYECRIDAKRKARLHQWLAELGPVLHHYLAHRR
ncbi:hypothetical protein [Streptomyces sp. SP18CS02]|uniref:hypothetical protein n=1 Tax=Streptomyces sp. SP18CS02 TaxID=3002531 RepID=UPI002E787961|nr:hypothetical protein [Streptomyces sp. SP18CS02]MEE1751949.1 hypothetical protein [Streptomyces sp. SP18CS02]